MPKAKVSNRLVLAAIGLVFIFSHGPLSAQETTIKLGVVDLERVFTDSEMGKGLQANLLAFEKQVQGEVAKMGEKAQNLQKKVQDASLSLDERNDARRQYEAESIAIRRFQDDKTREAKEIQDRGLQEIERALKPVMVKIRDEGGYDLILNRVAGVVVTANEKVDITAKVIAELNASKN